MTEPRRLANGDVAHGCELCDGEDRCTCRPPAPPATGAADALTCPAAHFVSDTCDGETCCLCGAPATHKIGEEIASDDPTAWHEVLGHTLQVRHNFTAYVCCMHFRALFGAVVPCPPAPAELLSRPQVALPPLDLPATFAKHAGDYLRFDLVEHKLHPRPDLCAMLLLDKLRPGPGRDMVCAASHDEFALDADETQLAAVATEADIITLVRCGVRYSRDTGSLVMFA